MKDKLYTFLNGLFVLSCLLVGYTVLLALQIKLPEQIEFLYGLTMGYHIAITLLVIYGLGLTFRTKVGSSE